MTGDEQPEKEAEKSEAIRWSVRPSASDPTKTVVIGAAGILAFGVGAFLFRNPVLGVVGFAIIFGSTAEFWLGTSFSIDEKKATVRTGISVSVIEWTDVKRIVQDAGGIRLSPLEKAGTMDAFRGVYLRYGKENRESIERAVLTFGKTSDTDVGDRVDGRGDGSPG